MLRRQKITRSDETMDDQKPNNGIKPMPEQPPHRDARILSNISLQAKALWLHLTQTGDARIVSLEVFLFSIAVMLLWRLLDQAEGGDSAIWDYIAQAILRGQIPY